MLKILLLVPILAVMGYVNGDLSNYEMLQRCNGKSGDIIAYPGDQNKFIVCLNDQAIAGVCRTEKDPNDATKTRETCFSESKQNCDFSYCKSSGGDADYEKFITEHCKDEKNFLQRLPARDCEKFYICLGASSPDSFVIHSCPAGTHFSRVEETCRPPLVAGCQKLSDMCDQKPYNYRFPSTNCFDYYECVLKKPVARSCEYGKHFDAGSQKCIPAQQSECKDVENRLPTCTINDNGRYFKHPQCDRFYVCVNTVPLEAGCPQDFYFDDKNQMCKKDTAGICRN